MKKPLLLLICVLSLLLLGAVPAFAQGQVAVVYWNGVYDEGGEWIDSNPALAGQQIPYGYDFLDFMGVCAANRGLARSAPQAYEASVTVFRDGSFYSEITPAESHDYWTGEIVQVDWASPFNPKMGTGVWAQEWYGPLGVLPVGHYSLEIVSIQTHVITDLCLYEDGQFHPIVFQPGSFDVTVVFDVVSSSP